MLNYRRYLRGSAQGDVEHIRNTEERETGGARWANVAHSKAGHGAQSSSVTGRNLSELG